MEGGGGEGRAGEGSVGGGVLSGVRDGGGGAEYAAGGNERQRQLPKRVTNHPGRHNPPMGGRTGQRLQRYSTCKASSKIRKETIS